MGHFLDFVRLSTRTPLGGATPQNGGPALSYVQVSQAHAYIRQLCAFSLYMAGITVTAPRANHARVDFRKSSSQARDRTYLNLEGYNDRRFWEDRCAGMENGTVWALRCKSAAFLVLESQ